MVSRNGSFVNPIGIALAKNGDHGLSITMVAVHG